jgi:hypothetical protein
MNTAKRINTLLDDMLTIRAEIKRMRADLKANDSLVNKKTGEKISAKKIEELANNEIIEIQKELNKVTNNGKSITGMFNNEYYVNDMMQDRVLVENGQIADDTDNQ